MRSTYGETPWYRIEYLAGRDAENHTAEDLEDDDVMVINAIGNGAEVLARALSAEKGKDAAFRRSGTPVLHLYGEGRRVRLAWGWEFRYGWPNCFGWFDGTGRLE